MGAIIAGVLFKFLNPTTEIFGSNGIVPESSSDHFIILRGVTDTFVAFVYICLLHILPELISVNKISTLYWNISVLPLVFVAMYDSGIKPVANTKLHVSAGNTFNPATLYALKFVHSEQLFSLSFFLQVRFR